MSAYEVPQEPFPLFGSGTGAKYGRGPGVPPNGQLESTITAMLRSIRQQPSALGAAFFSPGNVDDIQRRLHDIVFRKTRYRIDRQSDEQLLIIMRNVFVNFARFEGDVPREVRRLDDLVLAEVVPQVGAGLAQYLAYIRDASTLPTPIARGQSTTVKGTKGGELFRGL